MFRSIYLMLAGAAVGGASAWLMIQTNQTEGVHVVTPPPEQLRCEAELKRRDAELAEFKKGSAPPALAAAATPPEHVHAVDTAAPESETKDRAHAWRLSAIERFVPISDQQRDRLKEKFAEEQKAQEEDRESTAESLDDILGADNAKVYREQVNAAFERVQNEELEKDTMWTARKLGLSAGQEDRMRAAFQQVEQALKVEYPQSQHGAGETPQKRVLRMIAENKRRVQLRAEQMRAILSPEQYGAYMQVESESSDSDMEVFHGTGEEQGEAEKEQPKAAQ
jgi:hypothetical protein